MLKDRLEREARLRGLGAVRFHKDFLEGVNYKQIWEWGGGGEVDRGSQGLVGGNGLSCILVMVADGQLHVSELTESTLNRVNFTGFKLYLKTF